MKQINHLSRRAIVLAALIAIFSSCKKQMSEQIPPEIVTSAGVTANNCKPVNFGAFSDYGGTFRYWTTFMQKWYDQNGRLEYLKANFYNDPEFFSTHSYILWGRLIYHNNNQVFLDEGFNYYRMRVTLDAQQRPAASYYFHPGDPGLSRKHYIKDTSYYYFTGNRLDSTISLYTQREGETPSFFKHRYTYDSYGNLVEISVNGDPWKTITYDYSKPVTDMMTFPGEFGIPFIPYRLLEYMDLLHFPVHHQIAEYNNYQLLDNGRVYSYKKVTENYTRTFYTGWQCGNIAPASGVNRQMNGPATLEEFQRMYPAPIK